MPPEFFNPYPKYLQIRQILRQRLRRELKPGERFPTELSLAEAFGCSRQTVREALRELEAEGLIIRRAGAGTVVAHLPPPAADERRTGLVEDFTALKLDTTSAVLRSGLELPPPGVAEAFGLADGERLYRILRLRQLEGAPFALHDAYLTPELGAKVAARNLTRSTITQELRRLVGESFHEEWQQVDAVIADSDTAALLGIPVGAPVLVINRFNVGADGKPVVHFQSQFRADRYYYTIRIPRLGQGKTGKGGVPAGSPALPARRLTGTGGRPR